MRERWKPTYDLVEVRTLVGRGQTMLSSRARRWPRNHGWLDIDDLLVRVFDAMGPESFYKSAELERRPGTYADIYKGMTCDETDWYVKFFIDGEQTVVQVWSLCEDGSMH